MVVRPCLVWRLPATGWWGQITRQLAVETLGAPALVLEHSGAELGSGVDGFGARILELVLACWWVRPVPYMAGCRF